MIDIFNSISVRTSSTVQDLLNDLATRWSWKHIVYDTTTPTNVSELWVSDNIYLTMTTATDPKLKIVHTNGISTTAATVSSTYAIVQTDNALLFYRTGSSTPVLFCVARTINSNNAESVGVISFMSNSNTAVTVFTDNSSTETNKTYTRPINTNSAYNTELIPIYSITGDEHFNGAYFVFLCKSTDSGKITMNDKYYYFYDTIAIEYTP